MKNKVNTVLEPYKNKKMILSVSGGVDSLVLFDLLYQLKYHFVVVHFNHQQREQSDIEAKYIKELCEKNNIKFECFLLDVDKGANFQSEASNLRREHLIQVAKKYQINVIITAHHLDDLAETVILKISRGSNLLGYSGIQQNYYKKGFHFLKPLLHVPKKEIINYALKNEIKYYEDESNLSSLYTRNKIRHHVIPYLIKDNPAFLNKVIQYNKSLSSAFKFIRKTTINFLNNKDNFSVSEFINLDKAIQDDVVAYLLEEENVEITTEKIEMIVEFLRLSGPNATLDIGENLQFKKAYDNAYIEETTKKISFKQKLSLTETNILDNGDIIIFNNNFNESINNNVILCYNKMRLPLFARTREPGDRLYFSYGHKKLKDFYIDEKIPYNERLEDVLIVDNDGQILAVLGRYVNNDPRLKEKINLTYRRKKKWVLI